MRSRAAHSGGWQRGSSARRDTPGAVEGDMWVLGLVAACTREDPTPPPAEGDTDTDTDTDTDIEPTPSSFLRFVHVGAGVGPIDLWIDGTVRPLAGGLAPPLGSPFTEVDPGLRTVVITPPGGAPATDVLGTLELELANRERTTLVVFGSSEAVGFLAFTESLASLAPGSVRYSLFDAAATWSPVDASLDGVPLATTYGQRTLWPDVPVGVRGLTLDLDRDGAADCAFTIAGVAADTAASFYLVEDGPIVTVFGHNADGAFAAMQGTDVDCLPAPGGHTGDTTGGTGASTHTGSHTGGSGGSTPLDTGGSGTTP